MNTQNEKAWAFALAHETMIAKMCRRFGGALDPDQQQEFKHDVIVRVVERHHTLRLDDARNRASVISTWVGWQCRAIQTSWTRRYKKQIRECSGGNAENDGLHRIAVSPEQWGSISHADKVLEHEEARGQLETLFARASTAQRSAIVVLLSGMSSTQARERFGLTLTQCKAHVATIRE